jgi:hypothetical protein
MSDNLIVPAVKPGQHVEVTVDDTPSTLVVTEPYPQVRQWTC